MNRFESRACARTLLCTVLVSLFATSAQAADVLRTLWRGQWVEYVELGDYAVTEGDIIMGQKEAVREWRLAVERGSQQTLDARKALAMTSTTRLWLRGPSGVIEVPYTVEEGPATVIAEAVAEFNRAMVGVIQWVPRGTQTDYVAFKYDTKDGSACYSSVGRNGGRQEIFGDTSGCGVGGTLHEMTHAIGFWHVQSDPDAGRFLDVRYQSIEAGFRSASQSQNNAVTLNGYDYGSVMHYGRGGFGLTNDPNTSETRPPGIDIGQTTTLSRVDRDAIVRLYGIPTNVTTVTTLPEGLTVIVDGVAMPTPAFFNWPVGSVHRVWAPVAAQSKDGFTFGFGRWSHDPGEAPSRQLTWQVRSGGGGLGVETTTLAGNVLTANFVRLVEVETTPVAAIGGTSTVVAQVPSWPGNARLYPQFSAFDLTATPATGFNSIFTWTSAYIFNGGSAGAKTTARVTGSAAKHTLGARFFDSPGAKVNVAGDGFVDQLRFTAKPVKLATYSTIAPSLAFTNGDPGKWVFSAESPQRIGGSVRNVVDGIDGLDNSATGELAMSSSNVRSITIRAHREVSPYRKVNPSCAATIGLSDATGWVRAGSTLTATLTPSATSAVFAGWSGSVTGLASGLTATTTVGGSPPEFVADFNTITEPLRLQAVWPLVVGDDSGATIQFVLKGSGFSANTRVAIADVRLIPDLLSSRELTFSVDRTRFTSSGRQEIYIYSNLGSDCFALSAGPPFTVLRSGQNVAVELVEYYYAALDYYFLTGRAGDKAALDTAPAWRRTGNQVRLYTNPNADTLPLERHFFAKIARGASRGSHFFTVQPGDQMALTLLNSTNLTLDGKPYLEGVEGYAVPTSSAGACPSGTTPIYRAFKGPPRYVDDGNHRFSNTLAQHQDMVNRLGWTDDGVVFCGLQ
jgi:hypothetical protein